MIRFYIYLFFIILLAQSSAFCEVRGAYVTAWDKGFLTQAEADKTLNAAVKMKINTLYIQVRKTGDAYYPTIIEPMAPELPIGYDPLAYIIPRAHLLGIEVHAWVNVYRVWKDKEPPINNFHIANMFTGWLGQNITGVSKAADGMFIDPCVEDYRNYMQKIIRELLKNYNLDGIHLDYIRYPDTDWGYSKQSINKYIQQSNKTYPTKNNPDFCDWRRDQITEMVKVVKAEISTVAPKAKLSVSAICWGSPTDLFNQCAAYTRGFQDWKSWLEMGYIDTVIPMIYLNDGNIKHQQMFRNWLTSIKQWKKDKIAYAGIDIYGNKPKGVYQQMSASKKYGLDGFVLFSLNETQKRELLINGR